MASTRSTDSLQKTVQIELKKSLPATTGEPAGSPPEDSGGISTDADAIEGAHVAVSTGADDSQPAGGAQLLLTDARMAFMLVNHARKRAVIRVFGVSPENANVVTAIVLLLIADGGYGALVRLKKTGPPTRGDTLLAGAWVRAGVGMIAGPLVDETPGLGTLITIALVGHATRVAAGKSLHALRTGSHRLTVGFHHRYGYLIDPGHWREQRARRREALNRV